MVEIHEPARLAIVVEGTRARVLGVLQGHPGIERLVQNRWIWLACLDSGSGTLWELRPSGFVEHTPEHPLPVVSGESAAWYQGKRGFLSPVIIVPKPALGARPLALECPVPGGPSRLPSAQCGAPSAECPVPALWA
jgi:hypothetical protein